jgi:hypothetical protein
MKKIAILFILLVIEFVSFSQTNVSGGIYSNTTWTKANSPYIVTDTIVIFPNVILTIEPGVTVKIDSNKLIESRQGKIIAKGNITDSIVFTGNSNSLNKGYWSKIHINGGTLISEFAYCHFKYATSGILNHFLQGANNSTIEVQISNSTFTNNYEGIRSLGNGGGYTIISDVKFQNNTKGVYGSQLKIKKANLTNNEVGLYIKAFSNTYSFIDSSNISENLIGITGSLFNGDDERSYVSLGAAFYTIKNSLVNFNTIAGIVVGEYATQFDTIYRCEIKNNQYGIQDSFGGGLFLHNSNIENNTIGLKFKGSNKKLKCNNICNNTSYNLVYTSVDATFDVSGNNWCSIDSTNVTNKIYDGFDNISYGLVKFLPFDTSCNSSISSKINILFLSDITIYPNPFKEYTIVKTSEILLKAEVRLYNAIGVLNKTYKIANKNEIIIERDGLTAGLYYLSVSSEGETSKTYKLIISND